MLKKLCGHTIDVELLPEAPVVLDVGCRGYDFTGGILEIRPEARIIALDADPACDLKSHWHKGHGGVEYMPIALVGDQRTTSLFAHFSTGEADHIADHPTVHAEMLTVPCQRIEDLMLHLHIPYWDLVKLDCEGSEFGILENWPGRCATQISVEFHDYQDRARWNERYFNDLWQRLPDYDVVQHQLQPIGPNNTMGHWDTFLRLKGCYGSTEV